MLDEAAERKAFQDAVAEWRRGPSTSSASNTSTYLSNYLSDLFFAGCMVSASGYLRNFGSQSDDPRMAVSWKGEFAERLASARTEELRKSYVSAMSSGPTSKKDA